MCLLMHDVSVNALQLARLLNSISLRFSLFQLTWSTPQRKRDECSFKGKDLQVRDIHQTKWRDVCIFEHDVSCRFIYCNSSKNQVSLSKVDVGQNLNLRNCPSHHFQFIGSVIALTRPHCNFPESLTRHKGCYQINNPHA